MTDHSQLDADLAAFEATEASEADQLAKTQATNAALVQQHAQDQATIAALQAELAQQRPACLFGANVGGWEGETAQAAYTRISAAWPLQAVRVWGHNGADWQHVGIPGYLPPSLPLCIDLGSAASWTTAQWDALGQLGTLDPGRDVIVTIEHEPENDPGTTITGWQQRQQRAASLLAGSKLTLCPTLMGGTYIPGRETNGTWQQWLDFDHTGIGAIGADSYQWGKTDATADTASKVLQPVLDAGTTLGLPVVIAELGTVNAISDGARAQFLTDAITLLRGADVRMCLYYESYRGARGPWNLLRPDGSSPKAAATWANACR